MRFIRQAAVVTTRPFSARSWLIPTSSNVTSLPQAHRPQPQWVTKRLLTQSATWTPHKLKPTNASSAVNGITFKNESKEKPKKKAYIALGSNLGDRIGMIEKACNLMEEKGIKIKRTSSLWETKPMYVLDQENFVNGACEVETTLEPLALLDALQSIENQMGRKKVIDKGPRNIDLDILLYDDVAMNTERLTIPHALMLEREFVLRPLAELIPQKLINPANPWKLTQDYLNQLPPSSSPMSTMTPLAPMLPPIRALQSTRSTHIMAILNITPDSFSDGGRLSKLDLQSLIRSYPPSTTILDIGGQSTSPASKPVSPEEETFRILPIIKQIRSFPQFDNLAISVDTFYSSVARAAINAGADIINDVSAGLLDSSMLSTIASLGSTCILMHMRGTPSTMQSPLHTSYPYGLIPTIASELLNRISDAEAAGVRRWRIILDPGLGFAKTTDQNLEILRGLEELKHWPGLEGFPWLVGSSNKTFIGKVTAVEEPRERGWGTAATVTAAIQGGADIVRVHGVEEMAQVARMADAIWRV